MREVSNEKKKFQCGIFLEIGTSDETLTLLHSEQPKLHRVLAVLSAVGLRHMLRRREKGAQIWWDFDIYIGIILPPLCLPL